MKKTWLRHHVLRPMYTIPQEYFLTQYYYGIDFSKEEEVLQAKVQQDQER